MNSDEAVLQFYTADGVLALETSLDYVADTSGGGGGSTNPADYKAVADDSVGQGFIGGTSQVASSLQ